MTQEDRRKEVLDLLARGKISIDEAVELLDQPLDDASDDAPDDAKKSKKSIDEITLKIEVEEEEVADSGKEVAIEEIPAKVETGEDVIPRWLRISVSDLETGKSKVAVNIPFGMVKFGLGMAQIFSPKEYSANLEQVSSMLDGAGDGLLVDVQDAESNEHVRIYFE